MSAPTKRPTVMLVDGFGLIFRAYFAIPPTLATATGEQTNAVYGFATMLLDTIASRKPDYAVIALEGGRTFRHDIHEAYKGTRSETPVDLIEQIGRVKELIAALGIPVKQKETFEADDIIGSLSRKLADEGYDVIIVTGDSDLLQLVEDHIIAVLPGTKRFGELREYDTAAVLDRYGFPPVFVPDYKALVGDTSDNIPGVPGIGDKTAKTLIGSYGALEDIIANIETVKPPRAQKSLGENAEQAKISKHIATIVRDLDLDLNMAEAKVGNFDRNAVAELFRTLEFRNLLQKLPEADTPSDEPATDSVSETTRAHQETVQRTTVLTEDQLDAMIARIREVGEIALDVETTSTEPLQADLVGIAIAVSQHESWYVPVGHIIGQKAEAKPGKQQALNLEALVPASLDDRQLRLDLVREKLDPVIADPSLKIVTHHGKYDEHVLIRHGFHPGPISFDTMIAAYLLGDHSIRLKDLSFNRLGIEMTEIAELIGTGKNQATMDTVALDLAAPYACGDVESTFALVSPLKAGLEERSQLSLLQDIELPLVSVLIDMERGGIAIDTEVLAEFSTELSLRLGEVEHEITELVGRPINIGSPKQLAALLFEEWGLPSGRKTKTGYSVDSDALEYIKDQHAIVPLILEYRTLTKLKSTYVDSLPNDVNPETGRVHTTYNQTVAATGRLSSQYPNLQNIPIRTEIGRRVRRAFIADRRPEFRTFENATLLAADYSQMELRIVAHMTGEPVLVNAFRNGEDIHRATAALVNGVALEDVTSDMRRVAKTVNFGIIYGMQAFGLSRDTGMSRSDAQAFIDGYWERLPKVKEFFDETIARGAETGYVETLLGRRRYLPDLKASNGARRASAQRVAMNMPIQGTQADMIKIAMINLEASLKQRGLPARQVLQVHDELVLEVDEPALQETAKLVSETMIGALKLDVPVLTEVRSGLNWEDMHPFELE